MIVSGVLVTVYFPSLSTVRVESSLNTVRSTLLYLVNSLKNGCAPPVPNRPSRIHFIASHFILLYSGFSRQRGSTKRLISTVSPLISTFSFGLRRDGSRM